MSESSVRRRPRVRPVRCHARTSTPPQLGELSILEGGLAMVDDAVGGGGEMRGRSLIGGDRL